MLTEHYGVLVGRTLVDTSNWSAEVLVIVMGTVESYSTAYRVDIHKAPMLVQ